LARSARILRYSRDGLLRAAAIVVAVVLLPMVVRAKLPPPDVQPVPQKPPPALDTPPPPPPAPPGPTQRLAAIDLRGNIHESRERLLKFLGLTAGAPFGGADQTRLDAELKALGYRQLATEIEPLGGGLIRLHLTVEPVR